MASKKRAQAQQTELAKRPPPIWYFGYDKKRVVQVVVLFHREGEGAFRRTLWPQAYLVGNREYVSGNVKGENAHYHGESSENKLLEYLARWMDDRGLVMEEQKNVAAARAAMERVKVA